MKNLLLILSLLLIAIKLTSCSAPIPKTLDDDSRNYIYDTTVCTQQYGFAYQNCELKVKNNSDREIIATLKWLSLGLGIPQDKVFTNQTLSAHTDTRIGIEQVVASPGGFAIIEARYKQ